MDKVTKYLFLASAILLVLGLFWQFMGKDLPWSKFPLGRLPGDIYIKKENSSFYFPIVTCVVISVVVSLILRIFKK